MMASYSKRMIESWRTNSEAWTNAVRARQIESRRLVTDAAILAEIFRLQPKSLLDVGCGEGWLCRAVAAREIAAVGIDGSPELIDRAKALGGEFYVSSYEAMPNLDRQFDAIVCNFSLLEDDLDLAIAQMKMQLTQQGSLSIQTVHPDAIADNEVDGWQIENFAGFGADCWASMPWYFRRRETWIDLLARNGFTVEAILEPAHPVTAKPLSLLLICKLERSMV
jgi:2-polyprenyl-3-methyl-5-hydroxy-6-metoxy-1,4-benzoquinol methylase